MVSVGEVFTLLVTLVVTSSCVLFATLSFDGGIDHRQLPSFGESVGHTQISSISEPVDGGGGAQLAIGNNTQPLIMRCTQFI